MLNLEHPKVRDGWMKKAGGGGVQQKVSYQKVDAALDPKTPKRIGHRRSKPWRLPASDGRPLPSNDATMCHLHLGKAGRPRPAAMAATHLIASQF